MDSRLNVLAESQAGIVRRSQLTQLGIDRHAVRTQLRSGRWSAIGSMVIALHNGPLTADQQSWAAVLAAGRDAALAGRTALSEAGLRGWEASKVHVLVPRGRTPPTIDTFPIVLHETRWPSHGDLEPCGAPPRTRVERSAIDAAAWSRSPRTACGLVAAVVQQRLTTAERLGPVLVAAGPIRHRRALTLALHDIAGGAQALSEIDFRRLCEKHQLGTVISQRVRLDGTGKRRYLDGEIESVGGARVAYEVDGALHLVERTYWDDMSRANEIFIARGGLLRFPTLAVRLDEYAVADQIRRALAAVDARAA